MFLWGGRSINWLQIVLVRLHQECTVSSISKCQLIDLANSTSQAQAPESWLEFGSFLFCGTTWGVSSLACCSLPGSGREHQDVLLKGGQSPVTRAGLRQGAKLRGLRTGNLSVESFHGNSKSKGITSSVVITSGYEMLSK